MRLLTSEVPDKVSGEVELSGWVNARRDHGKLIFIDLRDKDGLVQIVFKPDDESLYKMAESLRPEWVINVKGTVGARPSGMENQEIPTGKVEVKVSQLKVLAEAKTPPFPLDTPGYEINEELRLKYRYLDLRRERMHKNLILRHKTAQFIRQFLSQLGFIEIETPYITKGTPEGAREFVVPSRLSPGKFYSLPQSPQQFKQLLMVAGMEKYFQIARVFRDEDPRADRSYGELTQVDIELSFASQDEILKMVEEMMIGLVTQVFPQKRISQIPFPRVPFDETMSKYGNDKPDLRKDKNDPNELAFCFIVDWPMFEWVPSEKRWDPHHHIFTSPRESDIELLDKDPGQVRSWQHDLVLNGLEVAGGSLRITDPKIQEKVFELVGIPKEEGKSKFQHMLEAFEYGVPPHGGIAIGLDRILIPLIGEPNIREVMTFPKTGDGRDLMMGAPSEIPEKQLKELHIEIKKEGKH
ncbi:MAG: aspartate--tRNA ligase [Candidatus Colwellbacteria bacterium]|nr:aspartate--tRNA ligase [Candidatus Colwellbacteria bacterium]